MEKDIRRTELGKKLKELRDERGLTIGQVAKALGIKLNTYGTYERTIYPKKETLIKIAEFFGVSLDYLMGLEEKLPQKNHAFKEMSGTGGSLPLRNYDGYQPLEEEIGKLTEREELFISIIRSASEEDQKKIARYLKRIRDKNKK